MLRSTVSSEDLCIYQAGFRRRAQAREQGLRAFSQELDVCRLARQTTLLLFGRHANGVRSPFCAICSTCQTLAEAGASSPRRQLGPTRRICLCLHHDEELPSPSACRIRFGLARNRRRRAQRRCPRRRRVRQTLVPGPSRLLQAPSHPFTGRHRTTLRLRKLQRPCLRHLRRTRCGAAGSGVIGNVHKHQRSSREVRLTVPFALPLTGGRRCQSGVGAQSGSLGGTKQHTCPQVDPAAPGAPQTADLFVEKPFDIFKAIFEDSEDDSEERAREAPEAVVGGADEKSAAQQVDKAVATDGAAAAPDPSGHSDLALRLAHAERALAARSASVRRGTGSSRRDRSDSSPVLGRLDRAGEPNDANRRPDGAGPPRPADRETSDASTDDARSPSPSGVLHKGRDKDKKKRKKEKKASTKRRRERNDSELVQAAMEVLQRDVTDQKASTDEIVAMAEALATRHKSDRHTKSKSRDRKFKRHKHKSRAPS